MSKFIVTWSGGYDPTEVGVVDSPHEALLVISKWRANGVTLDQDAFEVFEVSELTGRQRDLAPMLFSLPMPGDKFMGCTVAASGYATDESYGLLLIRPRVPFYEVVEVKATVTGHPDDLVSVGMKSDIVPAVRLFDETFGLWGGGPVDWVAAMGGE